MIVTLHCFILMNQTGSNNPQHHFASGKVHKMTDGISSVIRARVKARREEVLASIPHLNQYEYLSFETTIENTNFQRVFRMIFEGLPITMAGKTYENFWELGLHTQGIRDYKFENWSPAPLPYLDNLEELSHFPLSSNRVLWGEKPLKVSLPFVPKWLKYKENCKLYILDNTEAWYTGESIVLDKIPMSDVFTFKQCFILHAKGESSVQVQFRWFLDYHKSSFFKGTIKSSTDTEIKNWVDIFFRPALETACKTGIFNVTKDDIYHPPHLAHAHEAMHLKVDVPAVKRSSFVKELTPSSLPTSSGSNPKVLGRGSFENTRSSTDLPPVSKRDPLDEPINEFLRELQHRKTHTPNYNFTNGVFFRPLNMQYKGDAVVWSLMLVLIISLSITYYARF